MEISTGIHIIGTSIWLKKQKVIIINDLHIGYEEVLHRKGFLVPRFQFKEILDILTPILKATTPQKIIINGDLKHEFGKVLQQEWKEVLEFLEFCQKHCQEVIVIKGNHDPTIGPIAIRKGVDVVNEYQIGDILIVHGDELMECDKNIKTIIIGHEHPAITIRKGSKFEKYKCFLQGTWKRRQLIAVPSFNPLLEGTDILKEQLLSPFLTNLKNFEVYIVSEGEVFDFGKVKDISFPDRKLRS
jgi:uncharacterized protein